MLPKQENLNLARELALEVLINKNLKDRAKQSGGHFKMEEDGVPSITLEFLGQEVQISFAPGKVEIQAFQEPIGPREEVIIFHYLGRSQGNQITGQWISFAEIPAGNFYHPVFLKRCQSPLVKFFGNDPDDLLQVAAFYGGSPIDFGDRGVKIQALPYVPIYFVLWAGDVDFGPAGTILFDSSINHYLTTEDIVVLTETIVWKLVKAKGKTRGTEGKGPSA